MAGHSHSANIKYRKDRQDSARGQLFLKLRRKIENILREEGERGKEKALKIARENSFPKEKVQQIWSKIKLEKNNNFPQRILYQAPFGILIYLEDGKSISPDLVSKLRLTPLSFSSLSNYFQLFYSLKINLKKDNDDNLEEYLLTYLPNEVWGKIIYDEKKRELISPNKEEIVKVKKKIEENNLELIIEQEKVFWKSLIPCQLTEKEEIDYYRELEKEMMGNNFYANVEK